MKGQQKSRERQAVFETLCLYWSILLVGMGLPYGNGEGCVM